jgi:ribosomal protein L11 methyltransferase
MSGWLCIEVVCEADVSEHLAMEIAELFGTSVEAQGDGVRFYLENERWPEGEAELQGVIKEFEKTFPPKDRISYTAQPFVDMDWADRWKAYFKPLRVGEHLLVCPTWERVDPDPLDRIILMDPGRAFGTGHHETTRLCMEWLEEWTKDKENSSAGSLLDVGTGSGILAMTAALLGFNRIIGVDNDPEAIEVAEENVELNRLSEKVHLMDGSIADIDERFDVVLSNIQALPLIEMASEMAQRLKISGRLVLSGILVEQKEEVRAAYEAEGLRFLGSRDAGEWCLLVFEKGEGGI